MNLQRDFTWNVLVNYINGTSTNMETYSLDKANAFAEFARAIRGVKEVHVNFLDKAVERKPLYTTDNV